MAVPTNVNIKQLNQVEEVNDSDFLLVETNTGTKIIDFRNFVVGPNNVSWYNDFTALSSQVVALSASIDASVASLSSQIDTNITTSIAGLSATVNTEYSRIFYTAGILTIAAGETVSEAIPIITPQSVELLNEHVNVNFNSTIIPTASGDYINIVPIINGSSPNYALQVQLTYAAANNITVGYNILRPY